MVTHTLNLRLHPDDLTYIATHAGDRVLIADKVLWPLVENFRERAGFEHVIAIGDGPTPDGAIEYEDLLASAERGDLPGPGDPRESRSRHVLHERDDRAAERRPLLAPRDRRPLARFGDGRRALGHGARHRAPGRTDVPRERMGLPVHLHVRGRQAGVPRAVPRRREPARGVPAGAGHDHRGRADDLDGDPPGARRRTRASTTRRPSAAWSSAARRHRNR